ncbi:MAG: hypothetical protein PUD38_01895 [Firmicutes bacterium]|nr:hypothetical protein [Bacillota bacterium]
MTNWQMIKEEYLAGGTSYGRLAEKHGVSRRNLARVGSMEGWVAQRRALQAKCPAGRMTADNAPETMAPYTTQAMDANTTQAMEPGMAQPMEPYTTQTMAPGMAQPMEPGAAPGSGNLRLYVVADKLLGKIEQLVDTADPELLNPTQLRALAAVMKDLKQIQGIQSPLDLQEQMMRIEKLRRQTEQEEENDTIEVVFDAGQEEWNG